LILHVQEALILHVLEAEILQAILLIRRGDSEGVS
jgi:hypothetical protein